MGKEKRKRCPDFSDIEILSLVEFVASHKALLFGTGGKGSSKEEKIKERNWKKATAVLQTVGGPIREWTTVRKKWRDLASKAKAYSAPKTGGGPPVPEDPLLEKVLGVLAKEVVGGIVSEDDMADSQETVESVPSPHSPAASPLLTENSSFTSTFNLNTSLKQTTHRPASLRQCEIQEELLDIQLKKLKEKQKQTFVLQSILDVLQKIQEAANESLKKGDS